MKLACFVLMTFTMSIDAKLTPNYYSKSCPPALPIIRAVVGEAIAKERRMGASLIRLHFHDCFVQGCDASILLKENPSFETEQKALQNFKSARGYEVIDKIKSEVEKACPGVVSCADILTIAAHDSSLYMNGPTWKVKLGRRDSTTANKQLAEQNIPKAFDDLDELITSFSRQGLSVRDMVALSGAHTIGQAQCATFRDRIYKENNIDTGFAKTRRRSCPENAGRNNSLAPLDLATPNLFDNKYYKNLIQKKGLLHSDQVLFNGDSTDAIVTSYSKNIDAFFRDFASAMVKMGDINPLTGSSGEIRKVCSVVN
ncbi:Class I peroxidase protein [Dioscorea alata]|uniref:Class I peroxidase protein n=1 Tax=Dioscorea alata TaxID=55571 RepID=A0ACB7V726_DIOAL|nr:Class I peroxidase protein [Dioscorea alata]